MRTRTENGWDTDLTKLSLIEQLRRKNIVVRNLPLPSPSEYWFHRNIFLGVANPECVRSTYHQYAVTTCKSSYDIRKLYNDNSYSVVWTFERCGLTRNVLKDGTQIYIGGVHSDLWSTDYWIYNDVVVVAPNNTVTVYIYPKEVFPPISHHNTSLDETDGSIVIWRDFGNAEIISVRYKLYLNDYHIERLL